jgi:hypothetical protein
MCVPPALKPKFCVAAYSVLRNFQHSHKKRPILFLYKIKRLVFETDTECVLCEEPSKF